VIQGEQAKTADKVKCLGCKSGRTAGWCSKCKIKQCAKGRGLGFCSQCDEYPCAKLKAFHNCGRDYRLLAAKNLEEIKEKGAQKWLAEQKARWSCPQCRARFSWRDDVCKKCGRELFSCKKEAAALRRN